MLENLFQKLFVFAVEDRPLGGVVDVQQLEQNAENDGNENNQIHLLGFFKMLISILNFFFSHPLVFYWDDMSPSKLDFGLNARASEKQQTSRRMTTMKACVSYRTNLTNSLKIRSRECSRRKKERKIQNNRCSLSHSPLWQRPNEAVAVFWPRKDKKNENGEHYYYPLAFY